MTEETTITEHFDSQHDAEVINNGGFFCEACLTGKLLDDQSPDPRYCLGCYEFLLTEVELTREHGNQRAYPWMPKNNHRAKDNPEMLPEPNSKPVLSPPVSYQGQESPGEVYQGGPTILSTLAGNRITVGKKDLTLLHHGVEKRESYR